MSEVHLASAVADLDKIVEALLHFAEGNRKFALTGDLGAGKTAFVKAFCRRQNVQENVSSPTFALVNEYVFLDEIGREQSIHHLDLYRLKSLEEALDIGIENYLDDQSYCFIEWPDVISDLMPNETVFIKIEVLPDGTRQFLFEKR
ncbi:MAG: tRNA (adenosine(37)-N6)-threonylcarbamoyltransferase complex ATPase subunit type 1 TsaE [Saprospiraceae bacterium]|nr:tRNA (adenosine(37)-N6)-threonylcarbamoyltransferase complex ATPase subunit type 1 TsaE [Saprospiraceae bacterium]